MKLTVEQVRHVATLARLSLTAEEEERYATLFARGEVLYPTARAKLGFDAVPVRVVKYPFVRDGRACEGV